MNKKSLIEKLIISFQEKAEGLRKSFESARQAAIEAPGAMQSKSDTTKFQMSQLSGSFFTSYQQIQRCVSALKNLKEIDLSKECKTIRVGMVVKVEENQDETYYFILPSNCGGQSIEFEGLEITTISADSSIGQALLNKRVGDIVNFKVLSGLRTFKIIRIE